MQNKPDIATLLADSRLCRGSSPQAPTASVATGWPMLDAILPHKGWPLSGLIEVQCPVWGIGELRLFLPLMRAQANKQTVWLNPPFQPFGPALAAAGVNIEQHHLIHSSAQDLIFSADQLLRQDACGLLLAWPGSCTADLRRLQLAASQGNSLALLFYLQAPQHSFAATRLRLEAYGDKLYLQFLKLRGAHAGQSVELTL